MTWHEASQSNRQSHIQSWALSTINDADIIKRQLWLPLQVLRRLHLLVARPLPTFIQLTNSFDPESLRLTLKADSDPEFVISDLDLPEGTYFLTLTSTLYSLPYSESET